MSAEPMRVAMVGAEDMQARALFDVLRNGGYTSPQILPLSGTLGALEIALSDDDTAEVLLPLTRELVDGAQVVALFSADPNTRAEVCAWAKEGGQLLFDLAPVCESGMKVVDPLAFHKEDAGPGGYRLPDPGTLYLSRIVMHLGERAKGPLWAQALLPASQYGEPGVRELLAQAMSLITFKPVPTQVLGRQAAFNCWPVEQVGGSDDFADQIRTLAGRSDLQVAWSAVQSASFHCTAVSAMMGVSSKPGTAALLEAAIDGDETFGKWKGQNWPSPVDMAGEDKPVALCRMLNGETLWIWVVYDNAKAGKGSLAGRMILGGGAR